MALGADDVQAAGFGHPVAELDVDAAAGHVGRDRHRAREAGVLDDLRFLLVILRVEDVALDALAAQHHRQPLGFLDRARPDQHRTPLGVLGDDVVDDRVELRVLAAVHDVGEVLAAHGHVRRHDDDVEAVDVAELALLGLRGARHPGELVVEAEVVLEGDRRERLVLAADLDAFLRLDRLVDAVGVAAAVHQPAGELVDDDHLAVLDDVLLVAVEEIPGLQRRVELVGQLEVALVVEVRDAQHLLDLRDALLGDRHRVRLLVDGEVLVLDQARDDLGELAVELGRVVALARDDERRARLVDEDRVDFVDDREVEVALHHLVERPRHVVAQVVEPDLVVGDVGDVAVVGGLASRRFEVVLDDADGHPERLVDRPHPFGVALGEVVVDGDEVDALTGERVEVDRQRRDEGLAFAGAHLGDVAFVQRLAAHDLHVEVAHPQGALAGLADDREGLGQQGVELRLERRLAFLGIVADARALLEARFELDGLGAQLVVGERRDRRFERVDAVGRAA